VTLDKNLIVLNCVYIYNSITEMEFEHYAPKINHEIKSDLAQQGECRGNIM
jgi:hypothetical protein